MKPLADVVTNIARIALDDAKAVLVFPDHRSLEPEADWTQIEWWGFNMTDRELSFAEGGVAPRVSWAVVELVSRIHRRYGYDLKIARLTARSVMEAPFTYQHAEVDENDRIAIRIDLHREHMRWFWSVEIGLNMKTVRA